MKKNAYRNIIGKKAVVLGIALVFVFSAFIPAIGSQIKNVVSSNSSEDAMIKIDVEESVDGVDVIDSDSLQQDDEHLDNPSPLQLGPGDPWWNFEWLYRKEITINHSKVDADLTNFPVLISIVSDNDLANGSKCQNDGDCSS